MSVIMRYINIVNMRQFVDGCISTSC